MGAFADTALELRTHGLAPIPVDGKVPSVRWKRWEGPPPRRALERMISNFPDADVGVLTGLSDVTVVDVDDPGLVGDMINRFGDTPLRTRTRRGSHLWYRSSGEPSRIRVDGLMVDVKASGGMVLVPPSRRYKFIEGGWDALKHLPRMKQGSLPVGVHQGTRNNELFRHLLREVRFCDDLDDAIDVGRSYNADFMPPLSESEVIKTARSAWRCQQEDRNWVGGPARAVTVMDDFERLNRDADALAFLTVVRLSHGARQDPFALDARAMRRDGLVSGWGRNKYLEVTRKLLVTGDLVLVHQGGRRKGDTSLYRLTQ